MSFVVIAYPKIRLQDFDWLQNVRRNNDPIMFDVVKPHVTFIFPTTKLAANELENHVKNSLGNTTTFSVRFDSTKVVEDDSKTYTHTFLIPSTGFEEITKLHDILYVGDMASELRLDIPFIPHMGIGTNSNKDKMHQLAKDLDRQDRVIEGVIDELVVCEYDGKKVKDLAIISLDH